MSSKTAPRLSGARHPGGGNTPRPTADAKNYNARIAGVESGHRGRQAGTTAPAGAKTPRYADGVSAPDLSKAAR